MAHSIIDLIIKDHEKVTELYTRYLEADEDRGEDVGDQIISELEIHASLEEKLFYPVLEKQLEDGKELAEASKVDHEQVKMAISKIKAIGAADEEFDAMLEEIMQLTSEHIQYEETEVLPKAKQEIDKEELHNLANEMEQIKTEMKVSM